MNKEYLRKIVEETETKAGLIFDFLVQFFIVVSIVSLTIDTLQRLSPQIKLIIEWIEYASIIFFTFEYFLRVFVSRKKTDYIFSFFGIIDFLAVIPTLLFASLDLRSIRILRLLRIFRILKFARYSSAIRRYHIAFTLAREEIILFLLVAMMLIYLSAVGIYFFESEAQPQAFESIVHSLWWSIITLTTVGYGDTYPITIGGRIFTFMMLIIGLGVVSVPAGLLASALSKARIIEKELIDNEKNDIK
ncbi:MAG TPA: ion transporter [Oligoflexia bacterium]|nr:ion transporter [Oligoflexia bacterium]HMP48885.1 ion transporter [Oligoflexia bacterium]